MSRNFMYSAQRLGEIADTIVDIDNGLKWGFGWEMGPFETWDAMGVAQTVERMDADGTPVPTWVKDMLANGRQSFYDFNEAGAQTFWDPNTQSAVAIDEGEKVKRLSLIKRDPTNVVKRLPRPP